MAIPNRPEAGNMQMTDDQIYELLAPIADEEIMARNKASIIAAGRELLSASKPAAPSPAQTERGAFKAMHKHLDTSEETDAWGQPKFKHPHVESAWLGWKARAALQIGG
jgi:hypothetical protein